MNPSKHDRLMALAGQLGDEGRPGDACLVAQAAQYIEAAHVALEDYRTTRLLMRMHPGVPS